MRFTGLKYICENAIVGQLSDVIPFMYTKGEMTRVGKSNDYGGND